MIMPKTKILFTILGCLALFFAAAAAVEADEVEIVSALSADQEVGEAANDSGSFGRGIAEIEFENDEAVVAVEFDLVINEGTKVTRVHIHRGPAGQNGPVVVSFFDVVTGDNRRPIRVRRGKFGRSFEATVSPALADEIASYPEGF